MADEQAARAAPHGAMHPVRETHHLQLQTHAPTGRRMVNQYIMYVLPPKRSPSEDEIGHGVHGRVRLARNADTGERVAVKIVPREVRRKLGEQVHSKTPLTDEKVLREIAILKKCQHPNVVQLREVIDDPQSRKIFLVLEYMERGEIHWKDAAGHPTLTLEETRRTFRDVVLGLQFLHYQGIVHRDIKPANLLWDANYNVKISDFGVSHLSLAPDADDEAALAKTAGSPAFFAPELCLCGQGKVDWPITKAIDTWALGVTLYCLLFGRVPFTAETEYGLFQVIPYVDYALPPTMGADHVPIGPRMPRTSGTPSADPLPMSRDAQRVRDLLDRLLEKDPRKRISLEAVKEHPWVVASVQDAPGWLEQTDPALVPSVQVSNEEVRGALTGLPRLKQQIRRLHTRLTHSFHAARRSPSEVGSASPASLTSPACETSSASTSRSTSPKRSFARTSSRLLRSVPLARASTVSASQPRGTRPTPPPPMRAASATTLETAPPPEVSRSIPSAVKLESAFGGLQIDDYDVHHDLSDDDLDEDIVSHSSSSRHTVASEGARRGRS